MVFQVPLSRYGRDLEKEASHEIQTITSEYVRSRALRVTGYITRALRLEVEPEQLSKATQVNAWLEPL